MGKVMRAIGLMSGTSMDGIDVALLETDGEDAIRRGPSATILIHTAISGLCSHERSRMPPAMLDRRAGPAAWPKSERQLTERHADAVSRFMGDHMLQPMAIDVVGFHGQTVLHRPEPQLTVQLGDGPLLAKRTGHRCRVRPARRRHRGRRPGRAACARLSSCARSQAAGAAGGISQSRRRGQRHLDRP